MWNLHFDHILQEYGNQKAKTFYKKKFYGNMNHQNQQSNNYNNYFEEQEEIDISERKLIKEKNKAMNTIFDSSVRKVIDQNIVTTLDRENKDHTDNEIKKNTVFFTIETKNDFRIDLLINLTNKKNKRMKIIID